MTQHTFGYSNVGGTGDIISNTNGDYISGSLYTITENGTADSITVSLKTTTNSTYNAKCAIYKHSDLSLVGSTDQASCALTTTAAWFTFNFSGTHPTLVANTDYILVVWVHWNNHDISCMKDTGDTNQGHYQKVTYNSFPSTFAPSHISLKYSIYCTYTIAGGNNYTETFTDYISNLETRIQLASIFKIDIIGETESKLRGIGRVLSDSIGKLETRIKNISKFLSDNIGNLDNLSSYIKNIFKELTDKIGNFDEEKYILITSFDNASITDGLITAQHPSNNASLSAIGETFKLTKDYKLSSVKFKLRRSSLSPSGTLKAYLYTHNGKFGSTGVPTGEPLAISINSIDISNLTTSYVYYEFYFNETFTLENNIPYCILIYSLDGVLDASHYIRIACKSDGGYEGNGFSYSNSNWGYYATRDYFFYLYGNICLWSRIVNRYRSFIDEVGNLENKIKNISKILSDKIGINHFLLGVERYFTRVLIEVLGMVDTHTGIRHYIRVFLEKTGMKHKYNDLKNWYRYWFKERPRQRVNRE